MQDRRTEKRVSFICECFSIFDGRLFKVRLRDSNSRGIGIYSKDELKSGQEGVLFIRLPGSDKVQQNLISVCWCYRDFLSPGSSYPFRAGLRIVGSS